MCLDSHCSQHLRIKQITIYSCDALRIPNPNVVAIFYSFLYSFLILNSLGDTRECKEKNETKHVLRILILKKHHNIFILTLSSQSRDMTF